MTVKPFVILAFVLALAGCGRSDDTAKPAPGAPNAAAPDAHTDAANTVEVDEGMLRDLRITTRAVESRANGELVMLLGELAVDQDSYAEVGTPVAARVTRLLVNAGAVVRNGQPLVPARQYRIATTDFLWTRGDGYDALGAGTDAIIVGADVDVLADYFTRNSPISPGPQNRIHKIQ